MAGCKLCQRSLKDASKLSLDCGICHPCTRIDAIEVDGQQMRFCPQHHRMEPLSCFDGSRRTCREGLERAKARVAERAARIRARLEATSASGPQESECQVDDPNYLLENHSSSSKTSTTSSVQQLDDVHNIQHSPHNYPGHTFSHSSVKVDSAQSHYHDDLDQELVGFANEMLDVLLNETGEKNTELFVGATGGYVTENNVGVKDEVMDGKWIQPGCFVVSRVKTHRVGASTDADSW